MNLNWIFDVLRKILRYRYVKSHNTHWLQQISICVTNRCNARCRMCHAWKIEDHSNEATVKEFDLVTRDPVFQDMVTISLSGGEPWISKNLVPICQVIRRNVGDKWFILPTNAIAKEQILKKAIELKKFMRFNVCMSLDGIGELHDKIRGVKGLFDIWLVLDEKLREHDIYHDISCTIIKSNMHQIETIKDFARSRNLFFCFRPAANVSSDYFGMNSNPEAITSRADMMYVYQKLKDLHEKEMTCTDIGTLDFLRNGKRPISCGAGYFSVIVMANLDVYPCSHCTWKMGNLRDFNYKLTALLDSKQAKQVRKDYVNKCRSCVNDIEFPATLFAGGSYPYLFFKRGLRHIVNRISCHLKGGH